METYLNLFPSPSVCIYWAPIVYWSLLGIGLWKISGTWCLKNQLMSSQHFLEGRLRLAKTQSPGRGCGLPQDLCHQHFSVPNLSSRMTAKHPCLTHPPRSQFLHPRTGLLLPHLGQPCLSFKAHINNPSGLKASLIQNLCFFVCCLLWWHHLFCHLVGF